MKYLLHKYFFILFLCLAVALKAMTKSKNKQEKATALNSNELNCSFIFTFETAGFLQNL